MNRDNPLLSKLRHHISGAIERGEGEAIVGIPAPAKQLENLRNACAEFLDNTVDYRVD